MGAKRMMGDYTDLYAAGVAGGPGGGGLTFPTFFVWKACLAGCGIGTQYIKRSRP